MDYKNEVKIKLELYKNTREAIQEISPRFISSDITMNFMDIDEFELTIPKYIDNSDRILGLFKTIKTRHQILMTLTDKNGTEHKKRFILTSPTYEKDKKIFTCYSAEWRLKNTKVTFPAMTRQLVKIDSDTINIGEGLLNTICPQIGWKLGYVDPKARVKKEKVLNTYTTTLLENFTKDKVGKNELIYERDIYIASKSIAPIYLTFIHSSVKTIDSDDNSEILEMNFRHNFRSKSVYGGIKHIKIYQLNEAGRRFGLKYEIQLTDGNVITYKDDYINCLDKGLKIDKIMIEYDYGEMVEKESVIYRNTEEQETNAYKYLTEVVAPLYGVYFEFDTVNTTINVYSLESLDNVSGLRFNDATIKELSTQEEETVPTVLSIESENGVYINDMTLDGSNCIEDYSYYINNNIMSPYLQEVMQKYKEIASKAYVEWKHLNDQKNELQNLYNKAESSVNAYVTRIKNISNMMSAYFNSESEEAKKRLEELKAEIERYEKEVADGLKKMNTYSEELQIINNRVHYLNAQMDKKRVVDEYGYRLFDEDDLEELESYKEIVTLQDDKFVEPYSLYDYAVEYMKDLVKPKKTFTIKPYDLISCTRNPKVLDNLKPGMIFNLDENFRMADMFDEREFRLDKMVLSVNKDYETVSLVDCEMTNKILNLGKINNGSKSKTTNKVNNLISKFSDVWQDAQGSNNFVKEVLNNGLDVAAANIRGNVYKNEIDISECGIKMINTEDKNKQIALTSDCICITTDGWKHADVAISSEAICAKLLAGTILLSNKLYISGEEGSFFIGEDGSKEFGLYVYDNNDGNKKKRIFLGLTIIDGVKKAALRLYAKNGREVCISEDGIISTNFFSFSDNLSDGYPIELQIPIDPGVIEYRQVVMKLTFSPYRAYSKGVSAGGKSTNVSSSSGGAYKYTKTYTTTSGVQLSDTIGSVKTKDNTNYIDVNRHYHLIDKDLFNHRHNITTDLVLDLPDHQHTFTIDTTHEHTMNFGIFQQDSLPSNVQVEFENRKYVNITNGMVLDLTEAFKNINVGDSLDFKRMRIFTDTNGRITGTIYFKTFGSY